MKRISSTPIIRPLMLTAVKTVHTLAWFTIEASMIYLLYSGFTRKSDRPAALAGAVVAGETLIFAANGFRCPLSKLASSLGAANGGVTDIFLPSWFAHNLPAIHAPLLPLAAYLHLRNLKEARQRAITDLRETTAKRSSSRVAVGRPT